MMKPLSLFFEKATPGFALFLYISSENSLGGETYLLAVRAFLSFGSSKARPGGSGLNSNSFKWTTTFSFSLAPVARETA